MKRINKCISEIEEWSEVCGAFDPADSIDTLPVGVNEAVLAEFSARLTIVWEFLVRGKTTASRGHRVWAAVYVLRPELIEGEQPKEYAKRKGMSVKAVERYVTEFRNRIEAQGKESFARGAEKAGSENRRAFTRK